MSLSRAEMELSKAEASVGRIEDAWIKWAKITMVLLLVPISYGFSLIILALREEYVAVLNSEFVNLQIKPFQSMGSLGQRHVHQKLLELPIPTFDPDNSGHRKLSDGTNAQIIIKMDTFPAHSSLSRQRGFIRTSLKTAMKEIDNLAIGLLKGPPVAGS